MKEAKKRKRGSKVLIIVMSIVFVLLLLGIIVAIVDAPARAELKNVTIADVNFGSLKDGIYTGEYCGTKNSFRDVAVEVTIESGAITKITVTEGAYAGVKMSDEIKVELSINDLFEKVIESKSLQVDTVSGATVTVNAHIKAVENALLKAQGK